MKERMTEMAGRGAKIAGWVVLGVVGITALAFVFGLALMLLWNWLMPAVFGLPQVTYWQAVGLLVLAHILFKSHHHEQHGKAPGGPFSRLRAKFAHVKGEKVES